MLIAQDGAQIYVYQHCCPAVEYDRAWGASMGVD
jgi:hypothetical protein